MAPALAQQGGGRFLLKGTVLDETNKGIPGASIIVKGSTRGVTTDVDGTFQFEVAAADVTVRLPAEQSDLVSTRVIDGVKYILIRAQDGVQVNGVDIAIEE